MNCAFHCLQESTILYCALNCSSCACNALESIIQGNVNQQVSVNSDLVLTSQLDEYYHYLHYFNYNYNNTYISLSIFIIIFLLFKVLLLSLLLLLLLLLSLLLLSIYSCQTARSV